MQPIPGLPRFVIALADRCAAEGGRAFLVGGCVRDHLMGREVNDWDVEVFGIEEPRLVEILGELGSVNAVGRAFGVFKLQGADVDVSLPRRDSNAGPGHKGILVEGDPYMPVEEAARRRDLTINAILVDLRTGALEDPWNGRADLDARRLRAVDPTTFLEDPLRALRVVQFAARLEFAPDEALLALCRTAALDELPEERVQEEWRKLMTKGVRPSLGLEIARNTNILTRVFPEAAAVDTPAVDAALDRLASTPLLDPGGLHHTGRRYALMLAAWLHGASPSAIEATLDRLKLHKFRGYPLRLRILEAVAAWRSPLDTEASLRHLSTRAEIELTLALRWGITDDDDALHLLERARAMGIAHQQPAPLIQGRDLKRLGIKPGPQMGDALRHVYTLQLDGTVATKATALSAARQWTKRKPADS